MNSEKRREYIMNALKQTDRPISASKLAKELSVSRQIIVGDVALLRASGEKVLATPRGYVIDLSVASDQYTVACVHDFDNMEKELNIMVDNGATVVNVTVEHPLYGQLTAAAAPVKPIRCRAVYKKMRRKRRKPPEHAHRRDTSACALLPQCRVLRAHKSSA